MAITHSKSYMNTDYYIMLECLMSYTGEDFM